MHRLTMAVNGYKEMSEDICILHEKFSKRKNALRVHNKFLTQEEDAKLNVLDALEYKLDKLKDKIIKEEKKRKKKKGFFSNLFS